MKLTGKAKEDFDEWYTKKDFIAYGRITTGVFEVMPESMQWGVYVDFFDSKEICVETNTYDFEHPFIYQGFVKNQIASGEVKTIHEARTAAIEKANEIYNS